MCSQIIQILNSVGLKLGLRFCISIKFSSEAHAGLCLIHAIAKIGCQPLENTGSQPWQHLGTFRDTQEILGSGSFVRTCKSTYIGLCIGHKILIAFQVQLSLRNTAIEIMTIITPEKQELTWYIGKMKRIQLLTSEHSWIIMISHLSLKFSP